VFKSGSIQHYALFTGGLTAWTAYPSDREVLSRTSRGAGATAPTRAHHFGAISLAMIYFGAYFLLHCDMHRQQRLICLLNPPTGRLA